MLKSREQINLEGQEESFRQEERLNVVPTKPKTIHFIVSTLILLKAFGPHSFCHCSRRMSFDANL